MNGFILAKRVVESERGRKMIQTTTPWISNSSVTWEKLRRKPEYISYYKSLKNKGLTYKTITETQSLMITRHRFPTAHKFGLLAPADPNAYAGETHVFWHPDIFEAVVRFHIIDPIAVRRAQKPLQLSQMPGEKFHFLDASGTYHIRILGKGFWFQMQCDDTEHVDENDYIGFDMNHLINLAKKHKTLKEIRGLSDGSIDLNSPLHVPARLENHHKTMLAYDIRESGGSILDVIKALKDAKYLTDDPGKYIDLPTTAQNAYRAAKTHIYGDYVKMLNK